MSTYPINLTLRFLLELSALVAFGYWGFRQTDSYFRFVLAIGIPLLLACVWGIFNVPNDPSRSGAAPVITPGFIRLLFEISFFGFAIWCVKEIGFVKQSVIYGAVILFHYLISYDRIAWLLKN